MAFGPPPPMVTAARVEDAAIVTLRQWMPAYLEEAARQEGLPPLPADAVGVEKPGQRIAWPRTVTARSDVIVYPDDHLPALVVVSPGTARDPARDGQAQYSAWWMLNVLAVVSAGDHATSRRMAQVYAAAVRGVLLGRQALGGVASQVAWGGERLDPLEEDEARTLMGALGAFEVLASGVAGERGAPADVPTDPTDPWPGGVTIERVDVGVVARPLGEPLHEDGSSDG